MTALIAAGREQPFGERAVHREFPAEETEFAVGGAAWGLALELPRACLEHRFGAEVMIGNVPAPTCGTDDIALSKEAKDCWKLPAVRCCHVPYGGP
jgi:hypothetical protein